MKEIIFPPLFDNPAHERYGFGRLRIGETMALDLKWHGVTSLQMRGHISSHSQYHGKKFRTKTDGNTMYIKRIS